MIKLQCQSLVPSMGDPIRDQIYGLNNNKNAAPRATGTNNNIWLCTAPDPCNSSADMWRIGCVFASDNSFFSDCRAFFVTLFSVPEKVKERFNGEAPGWNRTELIELFLLFILSKVMFHAASSQPPQCNSSFLVVAPSADSTVWLNVFFEHHDDELADKWPLV